MSYPKQVLAKKGQVISTGTLTGMLIPKKEKLILRILNIWNGVRNLQIRRLYNWFSSYRTIIVR